MYKQRLLCFLFFCVFFFVFCDKGLIGGLLIPVLGAVPDGAIVLVSGLGDCAQKEGKFVCVFFFYFELF